MPQNNSPSKEKDQKLSVCTYTHPYFGSLHAVTPQRTNERKKSNTFGMKLAAKALFDSTTSFVHIHSSSPLILNHATSPLFVTFALIRFPWLPLHPHSCCFHRFVAATLPLCVCRNNCMYVVVCVLLFLRCLVSFKLAVVCRLPPSFICMNECVHFLCATATNITSQIIHTLNHAQPLCHR